MGSVAIIRRPDSPVGRESICPIVRRFVDQKVRWSDKKHSSQSFAEENIIHY